MNIEDLGPTIDKLYATRQHRLELTKQIDALKTEEKETRQLIINMLESIGLAKASGYMATASITIATEPVVEDWDKVHAYIRENNRFDLMQRRISTVAWRDMYNEGTLIPGTGGQEVVDISLTKSSRG